jgi:O-antigen ligase
VTVTITLVLVLFCSTLYSFTVLNDRVQSIFDKGFVSNTERILMWKSAWEMFLDHPIAGVGLGQYPDMDRFFYWQPQYQELIHVHAHSMYFSFLSETGLIGITAVGSFFGYILFSTYRKYRADPRDYWSLAMMLTTVAFLIGGFTEYSFGHLLILRLYLFVLGLSWVGSRLRHSIDSRGRSIA